MKEKQRIESKIKEIEDREKAIVEEMESIKKTQLENHAKYMGLKKELESLALKKQIRNEDLKDLEA